MNRTGKVCTGVRMNVYGSYKKLVGNAKAAMMGAIEIYNKPSFEYRDECTVVLLVNAWELLLKAVLSKNRVRIYREKKRGKPYQTISLKQSMDKIENFSLLPKRLEFTAIRMNVEHLEDYRNKAIHSYNEKNLGIALYFLSQTCISNFRDIMKHVFSIKLEDYINWRLLPLGVNVPDSPLSFLSKEKEKISPVLSDFIVRLEASVDQLDAASIDTKRLLTGLSIKLVSSKKIEKADFLVGVGKGSDSSRTTLVNKKVDPNVTHPFRMMDVQSKIGSSLSGVRFTRNTLIALIHHYKVRENETYYWSSTKGQLKTYSHEFVAFLKTLNAEEIEEAVSAYKEHQTKKRSK
jgi:hypothetical protein